jgi:hypothetical protein
MQKMQLCMHQHCVLVQKSHGLFQKHWLPFLKGYKGYKDGLQPESLADGKLAGETKSTSVEN